MPLGFIQKNSHLYARSRLVVVYDSGDKPKKVIYMEIDSGSTISKYTKREKRNSSKDFSFTLSKSSQFLGCRSGFPFPFPHLQNGRPAGDNTLAPELRHRHRRHATPRPRRGRPVTRADPDVGTTGGGAVPAASRQTAGAAGTVDAGTGGGCGTA